MVFQQLVAQAFCSQQMIKVFGFVWHFIFLLLYYLYTASVLEFSEFPRVAPVHETSIWSLIQTTNSFLTFTDQVKQRKTGWLEKLEAEAWSRFICGFRGNDRICPRRHSQQNSGEEVEQRCDSFLHVHWARADHSLSELPSNYPRVEGKRTDYAWKTNV